MTDIEIKLELSKLALTTGCSFETAVRYYEWICEEIKHEQKVLDENFINFLIRMKASTRLINTMKTILVEQWVFSNPEGKEDAKWCEGKKTVNDFVNIYSRNKIISYNGVGKKKLTELDNIFEEANIKWV